MAKLGFFIDFSCFCAFFSQFSVLNFQILVLETNGNLISFSRKIEGLTTRKINVAEIEDYGVAYVMSRVKNADANNPFRYSSRIWLSAFSFLCFRMKRFADKTIKTVSGFLHTLSSLCHCATGDSILQLQFSSKTGRFIPQLLFSLV